MLMNFSTGILATIVSIRVSQASSLVLRSCKLSLIHCTVQEVDEGLYSSKGEINVHDDEKQKHNVP